MHFSLWHLSAHEMSGLGCMHLEVLCMEGAGAGVSLVALWL